jgi:hypothetical protein
MPNEKKSTSRKTTTSSSTTQREKDQAFIRHLEQASVAVKNWPQWKQELLGDASISTGTTK